MYEGEGMDNHYFTEVHDIYVKDLKCKKVNVAALVLQGTEAKPCLLYTSAGKRMPHRVELRTEVEHVSVLGDVIQLKFMLENLIDEALSYEVDGLLAVSYTHLLGIPYQIPVVHFLGIPYLLP